MTCKMCGWTVIDRKCGCWPVGTPQVSAAEIRKHRESQIIRRLNDDNGEMSEDERERLLDDLACLQFADVGSLWRIPR